MPGYRTCIVLLFVFETFNKYPLKYTFLDNELTLKLIMFTYCFKVIIFHSYRESLCCVKLILSGLSAVSSIVCKLHSAHASCHKEFVCTRTANA